MQEPFPEVFFFWPSRFQHTLKDLFQSPQKYQMCRIQKICNKLRHLYILHWGQYQRQGEQGQSLQTEEAGQNRPDPGQIEKRMQGDPANAGDKTG